MLALRVGFLCLVLSAAASAGETVLLDFTAKWCGPCQATAPAVDRLIAAGYPVRKVDLDQNRQLAAQYGVTSVPTFLLLVEGRQVDRVVGGTSYERLAQMFQQAGVRPGSGSAQAPPPQAVRGQSPEAPAGKAAPPVPLGNPVSPAAAALPAPSAPSAPVRLPAPVLDATTGVGRVSNPSYPTPRGNSPIDPTIVARVVNASVRIRVKDPHGFSNGSGTIIDTHEDEALVLTCGHIFRDSQGKGEITIDVFGPHPVNRVPATLIGYDEQRDVGLVSFKPGVPVVASRVPGPGCTIRPSEPAVTVGCDRGEPPTARMSQVNAVNKFLGPSNITADGEPIQGRSGGGLFNAKGEVIGVCNAANPSDREGLYAALATIHAQLDAVRLSFIYKQPPAAENGPRPLSGAAEPDLFAAPQAWNSTNEATLASVLGVVANPPAGAEVICVVRSLSDPRAKSNVYVLDRVSPAFLAQLDREHGDQVTRRQTGMRSEIEPPTDNRPALSDKGWLPAWRTPDDGATPARAEVR